MKHLEQLCPHFSCLRAKAAAARLIERIQCINNAKLFYMRRSSVRNGLTFWLTSTYAVWHARLRPHWHTGSVLTTCTARTLAVECLHVCTRSRGNTFSSTHIWSQTRRDEWLKMLYGFYLYFHLLVTVGCSNPTEREAEICFFTVTTVKWGTVDDAL